MKKILSLFLVFCLTFICSLSSFAASEPNSIPEKPVNYGNPVEVRTYYDEELDGIVTERIYFVPDEPGISLYDYAGAGYCKKEKTFHWSSGEVMTYYAQGYFRWATDMGVEVSEETGGYENLPQNCSVISENVTTSTGGWSTKNASVTYKLRTRSAVSDGRNFTVTITVDENGNRS